MAALDFLTQKIGPLPMWAYLGVGAVGVAIFAPKLLGKGKVAATSGGLGNTPGVPADPNLDPNTGVPWSVEEATNPATGNPYYWDWFGPGASGQQGAVGGPNASTGSPIPPAQQPGGGTTPSGSPQPPQTLPGQGVTLGSSGNTFQAPPPGTFTPRPLLPPGGRTDNKGRTTRPGPPDKQTGGGPGSSEAPARYLSPAGWPQSEHTLYEFAQNHGLSVQALQDLNPQILESRGNWSLFTSDMIRVA